MPKLVWDAQGEHFYETGTDHGVLYLLNSDGVYSNGVAWNGLTGVTESPSGAEETALYADNIKYLALRSAEEFGFTITAYDYPDEWMQCDGSAEVMSGVTIGQQARKAFGFCYRSIVGNDTQRDEYGAKLHLIYNATASPSERAYATVNDSPEAIEFSYECSTTPIAVEGYKPTAIITIDENKMIAAGKETELNTLKDALYGTDATDPYLPLPDAVIALLQGEETVTLTGIAITTAPTKVAYTAGETFSASGMVVTATYSDSTTSAVTGYTFTPDTALTTDVTEITVSYTENGTTETATQEITVTAAAEEPQG